MNRVGLMAKWSLIVCMLVLFNGRSSLLAQTDRAHFDVAKQALNNGQYARAESEFRALLLTNPRSPEIMNDLAVVLQLQGKSDEAIREIKKVLKLKRLPEAVGLLAVEYCRNHQFDRAIPLLQEVREHSIEPNIMATIGPCFLEADQPEGAVPIYEELVRAQTSPEDENEANLARAYLDLSHKLLEALTSLPAGLKYARAIEAEKENDYANVQSLFLEAYQRASYLNKNMSLDALVHLLDEHSNDPSLLYILGIKCGERAADLLDRIESKWPGAIAVQRLVAELQDAGGDRDGAIQSYEQIVKTHSDAPAAVHFALGLMYAERNRWEDALREYDLAGRRGGGSLYSRQRISEALLHLGQYEKVSNLLLQTVKRSDAPAWALKDFGDAAQNLNHERTALLYLKRSSELDPRDPAIHYRLFMIYRKLNQPQSAAQELASFRSLKDQGKLLPTAP